MDNTFLFHQEIGKPIFSDLIWGRPQTRHNAGKLALVGGSSQGFNSVSEAYASAIKSGVGIIHMLLPDSLKKVVSQLLPESDFASSTKTGSFSSKALPNFLDLDRWSDGVLISGDLGHNSETAILIERYLEKSQSLLTLSGDCINIASETPAPLLTNKKLTLAMDMGQLQRFLSIIRYPMAAKHQMTFFQLAELLHALSQSYPWALITSHESQFFVAHNGKVSVTPANNQGLISACASATVWRLQQPSKPFEALTAGIYISIDPSVL